jgi:hypothetical protein
VLGWLGQLAPGRLELGLVQEPEQVLVPVQQALELGLVQEPEQVLVPVQQALLEV